MRRGFRRVLVSPRLLVLFALLFALLGGCTGKAETVRAAQPYIENFGDLRLRAQKLLELRADVHRHELLIKAMNGDEESLPANLKPLLEE